MLFGLRLKRPKRLPGGEQLSLANQRGENRIRRAVGMGTGTDPAPHFLLYSE